MFDSKRLESNKTLAVGHAKGRVPLKRNFHVEYVAINRGIDAVSNAIKHRGRPRAQPVRTLKPIRSDTHTNARTHEWLPASFDGLLAELEFLKVRAAVDQRLLLYRGHRRREWCLDSTFVRSAKMKMFGMEAHNGFSARLRDSGDLNSALTSLLLLKFGTLLGPSEELTKAESDHGVDAWFELMKRCQQYPEEDLCVPAGTNFLDWSQSSDVALYFANEQRSEEGSLFICDATATGKTLQILPVIDILNKIREQFMRGQPNGVPLLFSPPKQIANQRAKNQQAVYFAQMELRLDMLESWRLQESSLLNETIILKMVLPEGSEGEVQKYLSENNIIDSFIYPDKAVDGGNAGEV